MAWDWSMASKAPFFPSARRRQEQQPVQLGFFLGKTDILKAKAKKRNVFLQPLGGIGMVQRFRGRPYLGSYSIHGGKAGKYRLCRGAKLGGQGLSRQLINAFGPYHLNGGGHHFIAGKFIFRSHSILPFIQYAERRYVSNNIHCLIL